MFSSGPRYERLTANLRLSINRLKLLEKKKTEIAIKARKEIADYLAAGKEERARIRVEHIVRDDYLVEAMELVEMYCDLLLARIGLIQTTKELDPGLEEPIASILWATPRLQSEVQELVVISEQLSAKYGKEFVQCCQANKLNNVNEKLIHKLSVNAPPRLLIDKYLEEIAKTYNVSYIPDPSYLDSATTDLLMNDDAMAMPFDSRNNGEHKGGGGAGGFGGGSGGGGGVTDKPAVVPFQYPAMQQPYPQGQPSQGCPPGAQPYPPGFINGPAPPANNYFPAPYPAFTNPYSGPPSKPPRLGSPDDLPELPAVPTGTVSIRKPDDGDKDVNFDDLTRRFEELKKRK